MERIRSVTVMIAIDTNKATHTETLELQEDEDAKDLAARVAETLATMMELE